MPTTYIKKLASQGKGSIQALEKKWKQADKLATENGNGHKDDYAYRMKIFQNLVHAAALEDPVDSVAFDVPFLIRTLEVIREDVKSDTELHNIVERLVQASKEKGSALTMQDYESVFGYK
jgi:hypothetical protein